jgi:hypothetical protein
MNENQKQTEGPNVLAIIVTVIIGMLGACFLGAVLWPTSRPQAEPDTALAETNAPQQHIFWTDKVLQYRQMTDGRIYRVVMGFRADGAVWADPRPIETPQQKADFLAYRKALQQRAAAQRMVQQRPLKPVMQPSQPLGSNVAPEKVEEGVKK